MIDKEIIKIASNTENHGVLDNHTHFSKLKNAICGDEMQISLNVKKGKIIDFKWNHIYKESKNGNCKRKKFS